MWQFEEQKTSMEKVTGIGGLFFPTHDPVALGHWYPQHLGITLTPSNYVETPWQEEAGPSGLSPFPEDTPDQRGIARILQGSRESSQGVDHSFGRTAEAGAATT